MVGRIRDTNVCKVLRTVLDTPSKCPVSSCSNATLRGVALAGGGKRLRGALGLGLGLPGEPPRAGATLDAAGRPLYQKLPSLRWPQISPIETFLS